MFLEQSLVVAAGPRFQRFPGNGALLDPGRPVFGEGDAACCLLGFSLGWRGPDVQINEATFCGEPCLGVHFGTEGVGALWRPLSAPP